jgi:prepilin-type N-terminal cleavage/methylation domain-containing protein
MKNKGFSLMEMVVVLVFVSLSIALVTPSLWKFSKGIELKTAANKVSGILRYCRSEAVNKEQIVQVLFDSDMREIKVQSVKEEEEEGKEGKKEGEDRKKTYFLPEGIQIGEMEIPASKYSSDLNAIEFYPNGGSNGGSFLLKNEDRKGYKIQVHFLTGMVKVEKVEG